MDRYEYDYDDEFETDFLEEPRRHRLLNRLITIILCVGTVVLIGLLLYKQYYSAEEATAKTVAYVVKASTTLPEPSDIAPLLYGSIAPSPAPSSSQSQGALPANSIEVTATVLPVRTITLGADGVVDKIISNTEAGQESYYRVVDANGVAVELSAEIWSSARTCLAKATHSTGTICAL